MVPNPALFPAMLGKAARPLHPAAVFTQMREKNIYFNRLVVVVGENRQDFYFFLSNVREGGFVSLLSRSWLVPSFALLLWAVERGGWAALLLFLVVMSW